MSISSADGTLPQDELARLRAELAQEQAQLAQIEEGVGLKSAQLSYLNAEYVANVNRVRFYYEPKLRPLRTITFAAEERQKFINMQIAWLEEKIVLQDKAATENGLFMESRDMKPSADALMKTATQALLKAYSEIQKCPTDALRTLMNYESPPDAALETMFMVLRLRGEADMNGPIIPDEDGVVTKPAASSSPDATTTTAAVKTIQEQATTAAAAATTDPKREEEPKDKLLWAASVSWPHATVLVSHNYFANFFEQRSNGMLARTQLLEPSLMFALEAYCEDPDHTIENLYKCSTPIGCLGCWLHAVRDIYRVRMVTAPVLLTAGEHTTAEGIRKIHRLLDAITYGTSAPQVEEDGENALVPAASANDKKVAILGEAPTTSTRNSTASDSGIIEVEADLLAKYQASKKRLAELTRPSAAGQDTIYRLRHRLRQLDDSSLEAREEVAKIEAEMAEKMAEVRSNYDDSMLPLHDELEVQTNEFITVLTGQQQAAAAS